VGVFFTRGLLLDVAAVKQQERLATGYVITSRDLRDALDLAHALLIPGDIVLIHTGHGRLWMHDNKTYGDGEPGIGLEAARWLTEQRIVLVGADNWAVEAVPSQDPERPFEVHQWLLARHGVYILENLELSELVADQAYEFAFIFPRLKGNRFPVNCRQVLNIVLRLP
jgi:kynurenine formamidase